MQTWYWLWWITQLKQVSRVCNWFLCHMEWHGNQWLPGRQNINIQKQKYHSMVCKMVSGHEKDIWWNKLNHWYWLTLVNTLLQYIWSNHVFLILFSTLTRILTFSRCRVLIGHNCHSYMWSRLQFLLIKMYHIYDYKSKRSLREIGSKYYSCGLQKAVVQRFITAGWLSSFST